MKNISGSGSWGRGRGHQLPTLIIFFLSAPEEMDDKYFGVGVGVAGSRGRGVGVKLFQPRFMHDQLQIRWLK